MHTRDIAYDADGAHMIGQYVVDDSTSARRAGVLVCHEGPGLTEHTKRSPRAWRSWAMPPSPWTITAAAGQSATLPK